jgi:molybdopterin/thiamine biosynthesis adenylyltransferase
MDHTRHIGIFNAGRFTAALIGVGGIGAITALTLAKMGIGELILYDGDRVEDVNIPVQFHKLSDVGKPKVITIHRLIEEFADDLIVDHRCIRVGAGSLLEPTHFVISAVDSIQARKEIWSAVWARRPLWYLDTRMSAEYFQMFVVDMNNSGWYEDTLKGQDDSQIPDDPCTSKATIYTGCMAAGHIGAVVRRIVTGHQKAGILTHDILKNHLNFLEM